MRPIWNVLASAADPDDALYAQFGDNGPVYVLQPSGHLTQRFATVEPLAPMVEEEEAVNTVLDLIKDVPLARSARKAIAELLGVDEEDVGTAPSRKKAA